MKSKPIIVFDFDGVICDSTNECLVTSWNAWSMINQLNLFKKTIKEFNNAEINKFVFLRPRVRGSGEYYVLHRSLEEGLNIKNQETFNKLCKRWKDNFYKYEICFYKSRKKLKQESMKKWIDLNPLYQGIHKILQNLLAENRVFIATLKDKESVKDILTFNSINIPSSRIYDKSEINTKLDALNKIKKVSGFSNRDIILIDDNPTHLLKPNLLKFGVILASWGKSLPEFKLLAKKNKIYYPTKLNLLSKICKTISN